MDNSAPWMVAAGTLAAIVAIVAWWRDHARARRSDLDRVSIVPWTAVSFWATMLALLMLGAAVKAWI
ncbi:hypothetical protein [Novosphingobium sp. 9U]|uniref:hypothetical protein n=1 Tax=Novosphingobium sp. 9U TaxID=2653158 RepID=UPI0012F22091|nr:hypothetical protein [Novosphingobium sp. 9U]VWX54653.1 conserved hypothetical protein [Novosphingobium sp. 9U]